MSGEELPKVIDKTPDDIDAAIDAIKSSDLSNADKDFTISCIKLAVWLPKALLEHKIKLSNLRKSIFGFGGKNKKKSKQERDAKESGEPKNENDRIENFSEQRDSSSNEISLSAATQTTIKGHGRLSHSAYTNTIDHQLSVTDFKVSDLCPENCGGKLYCFEPGILVRVKGQNIAAVHKYWIQKLRCALCGHIISADIPSYVGNEKYDTAFKGILTLQKYYIAIPFYRQAFFQSLLGTPLPASSQWQLIEEVGSAALNVFPTLEQIAANYAIFAYSRCTARQ